MTVKTGQTWAGTFVTLDSTGALAAPSTGPAGVLYVDGTANEAAVTITGSNPYKWAVTLPSLTAGQRVDMYITATIATIATAGIVASEQADTYIASDIEALVDGLEPMLTDIHDTDLPAVKTETASILADTGTDGVIVASIANNAITAAVIATDAIEEIQSGLAALGSGGTEKTYTVTDATTSLPIADVHVWVSTDTAGANVIASGYTDVFGQIKFMLDAGTYYLWRQKAGYNFTNPDTETV